MRLEEFKTIKFDRKGKILYATFNNPEKLNAFVAEAHTELSHLFDAVALDAESEIVVLTGAGRAFSAGGDLEYMQHLRDEPSEMHRAAREAKRVVFSMLDCNKPIVCKINGDAIGLGATVALFCDVTFSVDTARISDPHNNIGLIAGDGGSVIWPQMIGYGRARHFLLTGERMTGKAAAEMGLIYKALPADELDAAVGAYADKLVAMPTRSLRWTKETYTIPLKQLAHSMMDAGMAYETVAGQTADHGEAIAAFREKRKPKFTGR